MEVFITSTATQHQRVIEMLWLRILRVLVLSVYDTIVCTYGPLFWCPELSGDIYRIL